MKSTTWAIVRYALVPWLLLTPITTLAAQEIFGGTFGANVNYSIGIASERKIRDKEEAIDWTPQGPRFAVSAEVVPNLELELSGALLSSEDISSFDAIASAHYNIATGLPLTPYIGGGGGLSSITYGNRASLTFAFQAAAGIVYEISTFVGFVFGYRLTGTTETTLSSLETADTILEMAIGHNIELGLIFFPQTVLRPTDRPL